MRIVFAAGGTGGHVYPAIAVARELVKRRPDTEVLFIMRGFKIAREAPDMFGFLLASGLSFAFGVQVFVNIGVATRLLPTTGVTLPFISYGGSSLLLSFATTGILLNISKHSSMERTLSREFGNRIHRRFPS